MAFALEASEEPELVSPGEPPLRGSLEPQRQEPLLRGQERPELPVSDGKWENVAGSGCSHEPPVKAPEMFYREANETVLQDLSVYDNAAWFLLHRV